MKGAAIHAIHKVAMKPSHTNDNNTEGEEVMGIDRICLNYCKCYKYIIYMRNLLHHIPILNFFYELIYSDTPSEETAKGLLNLVSLVDALMLGLAVSFLTGVDFSENLDADIRYTTDNSTGYYEFYQRGNGLAIEDEPPSATLAYYGYNSIATLFAALVISILAYMDLTNKDFSAHTAAQSRRMFSAWWDYSKYAVLLALILSVMGITSCIDCTIGIIVVKFPDIVIRDTGHDEKNVKSPVGNAIEDIYDDWWLLLIGMFLLGLGTQAAYLVRLESRAMDNVIKHSVIVEASVACWGQLFKVSPDIEEFFGVYAQDYIQLFIEARIDFDDRRFITDMQLQSIGVSLVGHRIKFLQLFQLPFDKEKGNLISRVSDTENFFRIRQTPSIFTANDNRVIPID